MIIDVAARDIAVAAVGLTAATVVGWIYRSTPVTAMFLAAVVLVSAWLSAIDFREFRLPNRIVGPLAVGGAIWVVGNGIDVGDVGRVIWAFALAVIAFIVLFAMNLMAPFGMGDVKYGTTAVLILGWFGASAISTAVLVMALSGGLVALVMLTRGQREHHLAYGPYMALGLVAGLVTAGL